MEAGRIELRNFGVYELKKRAARNARNPRTGQRGDVPEKTEVTCTPGTENDGLEKNIATNRVSTSALKAREPPSC